VVTSENGARFTQPRTGASLAAQAQKEREMPRYPSLDALKPAVFGETPPPHIAAGQERTF